ncbi:MAG TPA: hypothetical protein VKU77_05850 [Streptosporangiaceae bacterium]|nr:hypothetical protein [Streptosporangiaceae bacterium]
MVQDVYAGLQVRWSHAADGGFIIGWIGQGALCRLPILQPYLPGNVTLIIAWLGRKTR